MIFLDSTLRYWRHCFVVVFALSLISLYTTEVFSQGCNIAASGDVICPSGSGSTSPFSPPPSPNVSTGSSVFGSTSPLFSTYATTPATTLAFVNLESLFDSVPDALKNLLLNEALSILSGNDVVAQIANLVANFQQITSVINGLSGLSFGGITVGGDLEAYATNNIVQQLSGQNISSMSPTEITGVTNNSISSIEGATSTVTAANVSDCDAALLDIVQSGESTCAGKPPYDVVYSCATPTIDGRPLSQWSVAELQEWQVNGIRIGGKKFSAAGRYQFIQSTINPLISRAVASGELRTSDKFDQNAQDLLAIKLADAQGGLDKYKRGEQSLERTIYKIATIWASLEYAPGKGVYDGDSVGNHAKAGTYEQVKSVLMSSACTSPSAPTAPTAPATPTGPF